MPALLAAALPLMAVGAQRRGFGGNGHGGQRGQNAERERLAGVGPLQRAFNKGKHLLVEQFSSARKALLRGVFAQVQIGRDGFDGLMFAIKQDERFAIDIGDFFERTPQDGFFFPAHGLVGRGQFARGQFVRGLQRFGGVRRFVSLAAMGFINPVPQDAAKP
jgi:hypothetical protein